MPWKKQFLAWGVGTVTAGVITSVITERQSGLNYFLVTSYYFIIYVLRHNHFLSAGGILLLRTFKILGNREMNTPLA